MVIDKITIFFDSREMQFLRIVRVIRTWGMMTIFVLLQLGKNY